MSRNYKHGDKIPSDKLCKRLNELSEAVTQGPEAVAREFNMRIPAELDRDADLVLSQASIRIAELEAQLAAAEADAERYRWLRDECDDWALFQGYVECEKEGLNAAIDTARKQATAPEQEGER